MNNGAAVKLFDANNKLVPNFEQEIEKVLISVHGENYYDVDCELVNTNEIPVVQETASIESLKVKNVATKKEKQGKISFKDFIPVLFFMFIFAVIIVAGYYFLNTVDLMELIGVGK